VPPAQWANTIFVEAEASLMVEDGSGGKLLAHVDGCHWSNGTGYVHFHWSGTSSPVDSGELMGTTSDYGEAAVVAVESMFRALPLRQLYLEWLDIQDLPRQLYDRGSVEGRLLTHHYAIGAFRDVLVVAFPRDAGFD